ncbi:Ig-like domain-containing protein [Aerococcaceae bacterium NML160702]|nr:Ig-like domain-containing protein [Aerococcaceae bacterium NML160702]
MNHSRATSKKVAQATYPLKRTFKVGLGLASIFVCQHALGNVAYANEVETDLPTTPVVSEAATVPTAVEAPAAMSTNTTENGEENSSEATEVAASEENATPTSLASDPKEVTVDLVGEGERRTLFVKDWKTKFGDMADAKDLTLDDSTWDTLDLPHDYSIDKPYDANNEAESGFLPGGVQWYRKSFVVAEKYKGKRVNIEFDGVYMNAEVYLNGRKLATHPYGYTSFAIDLTDDLVMDGTTENVLAVRVNNELPSSRWYSGSGIYRDVHLTVTEAVHVDYHGVKIETPDLATTHAGTVAINAMTQVVNTTDMNKTVSVMHELVNADNEVVASSTKAALTLNANSSQLSTVSFNVERPTLWSVDNPYMYKVRTKVFEDEQLLDTYVTDYGFRYFDFDRDTGFSLNGQKMKLKGVSMHHDQGSLGAVANPAAIERQILILKEMGANAIRSTHNPAASILIELANKHGMLVIDEAFDGWSEYKNANVNDYTKHFNRTIAEDNKLIHARPGMTWAEFDIKTMVNSRKNAPSVIMWSIGNEITEGVSNNTSHYVDIARNLIKWVQEVDTTRRITIGDNRNEDRMMNQINDLITEAGGIVGKNYKDMRAYREAHPNWILYGSETASAVHSRGVYNVFGRDDRNLQMSAYNNDHAKVPWGTSASKSWQRVIENDWNAGEFVWTGFDYLGEPTPWNGIGPGSVSRQGAKPKSSFFGIVDTAGFPKDTYYLYRSMWHEKSHTLHVMPTWNTEDLVKTQNGKVQVDVFTDAARVELYLNGRKIGEQTAQIHTTDAGYRYKRFAGNNPYASFNVDWEAGELTAKAFDENGNEITTDAVGRKFVKTYTDATQLKTKANRETFVADGRDLVYVEVDVLDANGTEVSSANNLIKFEVQGPGKIVGVDNGNPSDTDSYQAPQRRAFSGKALVIIQSTANEGDITLTATSDGLTSSAVTFRSVRPKEDDKTFLRSYSLSRHLIAKRGHALNLPESIAGTMSNGAHKDLKVTWEKPTTEQLNGNESFELAGTIEGYDTKLSVTVNVIDDVTALENYATVIRQGTTPNLPKTRRAFIGHEDKALELPVTWQLEGLDFNNEATVTIPGYTELFGKRIPVTATVRVVHVDPPVNIAARTSEDAPRITNGYTDREGNIVDRGEQPISDKLVNLNNGIHANGSDVNERWTNWSVRNQNPIAKSYVQFEWQNAYTIQNLKLWHFTDNAGSVLPGEGNVRFEYWDGEKSAWVETPFSNITQASYLAGETPYGFVKPVTTNKLRIWLQAPRPGRTIGLTEVEVYTAVEDIVVHPNATLSTLKVNGETVDLSALTDNTYTFALEGKYNVEATADNNAAVTVIPVAHNSYIVKVTSEDQQTSTLYHINNTLRVEERYEVSKEEVVPFEVKVEHDATQYVDYEQVRVKGVPGKRTYYDKVVYVNGKKDDSRTERNVKSEVTLEPVTEVRVVGTKERTPDKQTKTLTDAKTGIRVVLSANEPVQADSLKVVSGGDIAKHPEALRGKDYDLYDIEVMSMANEEIDIQHPATVSISVDATKQVEVIAYVPEQGELVNLPFKLVDGRVEFEAKHFSFYAVVYQLASQGNTTPPKQEEPKNEQPQVSEPKGETPKATEPKKETPAQPETKASDVATNTPADKASLPATGEDQTYAIFGASAMAILLGLGLVSGNKRQEDN